LVAEMVGRRLLLERVSEIQRQIVRRSPGKEVLDAIVEGAAELTASEIAFMRRIDLDDSSITVIVASHGLDTKTIEQARLSPAESGVGGRAAEEDRLVVVADYKASGLSNPALQGPIEA